MSKYRIILKTNKAGKEMYFLVKCHKQYLLLNELEYEKYLIYK